jgi:translocation and assembly module TamA
VEIDAPDALKGILQEHLDLARYTDRTDISDDQFQYMVETVDDQVRQFASTEGWFDPVTKATVEGEGDKRVVHISVDPGARTLIRAVDVQVTGPAATQSPEQVEQMRAKWGLPVGEPFRQSAWDKAKEDALVTLQSRSYYGAKLARRARGSNPTNRPPICPPGMRAGRPMLGPLVVEGTRRYPEQIVRNVNPLNVGEPYRVERLLELQRAVQNQPYFSNVQVDLVEPADAEPRPRAKQGLPPMPRPRPMARRRPPRPPRPRSPIPSRPRCACGCASNRCIASIPASVTRPTLARR